MVTSGYSATPLSKKLGIKQGHSVLVVNAPDHMEDLLPDLPASVHLILAAPEELASLNARGCDVLLLFCIDRPALDASFAAVHRLLTWDGGLWVCWPKRSSPLASDFKEDDVRVHGLESGLVDNKICAIDQDWSGLRFVHRVENRPPR